MKYHLRFGKIPDGSTPLVGQSATARRADTGEALGSAATDDTGFITFQADGHWPPFYLQLAGVPGGDKFWRSDESHAIGPLSPREIPAVLRSLGDGVVRGYTSQLQVTLTGTDANIFVAPGAANVAGHPVVFYGTTFLASLRPLSGSRLVRVVIRLYPEGSATTPGKADLALLTGAIGDAAAPALTQTTEIYEIALATVTVPNAGTVTLVDERQYTGEPVAINASATSPIESTASAVTAYFSHLDLPLVLPNAVTYDVTATATATATVDATRVLIATYGTFGAATTPLQFRTPSQVAFNGSNPDPWVADTANNRFVGVDASTGSVGANSVGSTISGICFDSGGNLYFVGTNPTQPAYLQGGGVKLSPSFVTLAQWSGSASGPLHCATDNTYLYYTISDQTTTGPVNLVSRRAVDLTGPTIIDSDVSRPYGIAYYSGGIYVVDSGNNRVKVLTSDGAVARTWAIPAGCAGIAVGASGAYVANPGAGLIYWYSSVGALLGVYNQVGATGVGLSAADVLWATNATNANLNRWNPTAPGYGVITTELNASLGSYTGIGNVNGTVQTTQVQAVIGPATISVRVAAKATSGTATFSNLVHSARAVPRG